MVISYSFSATVPAAKTRLVCRFRQGAACIKSVSMTLGTHAQQVRKLRKQRMKQCTPTAVPSRQLVLRSALARPQSRWGLGPLIARAIGTPML